MCLFVLCLIAAEASAGMKCRITKTRTPEGGTRTERYCWYEYNPPGGGGPGQGSPGGGIPGGGGGGAPNPGAPEQPTQDSTVKKDDCEGNPVIRSTGNKIEPELDFAGDGEMSLYLQRIYNHYWTGIGLFGKHWISNFDYSLSASVVGGVNILWVQYPDGRRIKFIQDAGGRYNEDKPQPIAWAVKNADGSYTVHNESRGIERYDADGHIAELRNEQGIAWVFTYSGQYLQKVTHSAGRSVQFAWTNGQLTQVTDPAGNLYKYTYTANVFGTNRGRLASTILPGTPGTTITYHYEDSRFRGGLTGKSFNGVRYSTFAYDLKGRAVSTEHAGGVERYTFSYAIATAIAQAAPPAPPPPGGFLIESERDWCSGGQYYCKSEEPNGLAARSYAMATTSTVEIPSKLTVTVTNPLGKKADYLYENGRLTSMTGQPSPHCPVSYRESTYDANGYENLVTDFEDGITDYDYDAQGHLLKKVEATGKPEARTTTYGWDLANDRLLRETVVGLRETTYTYDGQGRIASVSVKNLSANGVAGQVQKTSYTYTLHANGLVATRKKDGPIAGSVDAITETFSSTGDLLSVANGLGHTQTYASYNALGQPGVVTGPNGDKRSYTYDARGRVQEEKTYRNGGTQTTAYVYDGFDRLAAMTLPDGIKRYFQYDVAGRLLVESESEAGGYFAQKAYAYNALSKPIGIKIQRASTQPLQGTQP